MREETLYVARVGRWRRDLEVTAAAIAERHAGGSVERAFSVKPTLCMINYNGERFLRESLGASLAQAEDFAEIILIDNGSEDRSLQIVERNFPSVRIVRLPENRGAGAARNAGLREARTRLVLLVDNDVSLAPGCVGHLTRALDRHPEALIAAPAVLYARKKDIIQYDGADNHFVGLMILHHQDLPLAALDLQVRQTNSVVTACFLVDRSRLPEIEPFDEAFFYMLEDHDFGVRMRAFGHQILSVPAARCYHGEGTEGLSIRQIGNYSRVRVYYLIRNRWLFICKNYSLRSLVVLTPMLMVYELAQFVVVVKKGWITEWFRASWWIVRHSPSIFEKRRRVQLGRKTLDRDLLADGPIPFRDELTTGRLERVGRQMLNAAASWYWKRVAHFIR
jgi:GT2 family glycosyltransferase